MDPLSEPTAEDYEGTELATFHDEETHEHIIVVYRELANGDREYLVASNWWLVAGADEDPRQYCVAKLPCYVYDVILSLAERDQVVRMANDFNGYIHSLLGFPPEEQFSADSHEPF